jgi:peptidoglycan hydrolase CwlO-like protein
MSRANEIQAAIEGFEAQKQRLDEQIAELRRMLSGANAEPISASPANGRRTMSPAARKRIADAMRKRWAAVKKGAVPKAVAPAPKKAKRRLSPEGRRRIIAATKKRWMAFRVAAAKRGK